MKQIEINRIRHIKDYILELEFSDSCIKQLDFSQLLTFKGIAVQLKDIDYFKNVKIINSGRAFGWENGYDCCSDWARYFATDLQNEWTDYDDNIDLKERIQIAHLNIQQTVKLL